MIDHDCWMPDEFRCPHCSTVLTCEEDYAGGGSHYWVLRCATHGRFTASNYRHGGYDGMIPRAWAE